MMHDGFMNSGWGGGIVQILILVIVIIAVVWAIRYFTGQRQIGSSSNSASALEILKRRYANGEIDKEEFEQKKKDLNA